MVEQVRVNPTEVRGYGNICEEHSLDDFIVSSSGLAKEKENIHGALTEVYKLVYSLYGLIFSFDKGNKQLYLHSDNDAVVGFSFSEKSLVFKTISHISFGFADKDLVVDDEYYLFVDNGTSASHNDHWYINSFGTATVQNDGTKLLNTSGNTNFVMRSIIPSNKTITEANSYSYNPPYIVEFDIVETNGTSNSDAQVQIYSQQSNNNFAKAVTTGHYKIEVTSEEQKIWVDDTLIKTTNLSLPNARVTLRVRNGKYLIYKNLKIYG